MSRSYKRHPGWKLYTRKGTRIEKRLASKKVRRTDNLTDGRSYRKVYDTYNICDYKEVYYGDPDLRRAIRDGFDYMKTYLTEEQIFIRGKRK